MAQPTPWWETIRLRDEIASASGAIEDVQMSLFNAVHGVAGRTVAYADARYYADITFPSGSLIELMAQIAVRLGTHGSYEAVRAVRQLHQGMGGGKSHGLIGIYHLAANTAAFAATEVGQKVMASAEEIAGKGSVAADLNRPRVVVLSCDNMTPGRGDKDIDGPADTLGERFLWRLFDGAPKLWSEYRADTANKSRLAEAIDAVGRPVLILVDEVMDYIRKAAAAEQTDLVIQDMAFLRALLDTVDFLRHEVHVRRQVKRVGGRLWLGLPKGGRERTVPLPETVALALAAHIAAYPPAEVSMPWHEPGARRHGQLAAVPLLFVTPGGRELHPATLNSGTWCPARQRAGAPADGMHALRHYYASALLAGGVDIRALSEFLGHHDAGFTLRTYCHLVPEAGGRARKAIEEALSASDTAPATAQDEETGP